MSGHGLCFVWNAFIWARARCRAYKNKAPRSSMELLLTLTERNEKWIYSGIPSYPPDYILMLHDKEVVNIELWQKSHIYKRGNSCACAVYIFALELIVFLCFRGKWRQQLLGFWMRNRYTVNSHRTVQLDSTESSRIDFLSFFRSSWAFSLELLLFIFFRHWFTIFTSKYDP